MPSGIINRSIDVAASRVPGLRRLPVMKLLAIGEVGLLARDHVMRLTPDERRRLVALIRIGRGRRSNLGERERKELAGLVAKLEPRLLAGEAVDRFSPLPIPKRLIRGPRKR
jgi:hypothetical protein